MVVGLVEQFIEGESELASRDSVFFIEVLHDEGVVDYKGVVVDDLGVESLEDESQGLHH